MWRVPKHLRRIYMYNVECMHRSFHLPSNLTLQNFTRGYVELLRTLHALLNVRQLVLSRESEMKNKSCNAHNLCQTNAIAGQETF